MQQKRRSKPKRKRKDGKLRGRIEIVGRRAKVRMGASGFLGPFRWYWRRRAPNGQIAGRSSESYPTKANAKRAAKREYPGLRDELVRVIIIGQGVHSE